MPRFVAQDTNFLRQAAPSHHFSRRRIFATATMSTTKKDHLKSIDDSMRALHDERNPSNVTKIVLDAGTHYHPTSF